MKKIALLLGLLLASPAFAADNAVIVTPGTGVTMKSKDVGTGVQAMQPILSDASGNALLTTLGADAVSNTLTGIPVYARNLVFNGTTWDRWQGAVTNAGTFAVQLSGATNNINNIAGTVSLPTGASTSANQTTINTSIGTTNTTLTSTNTKLDTIITNTGAAIPAGTATIGNVGADPSSGKGTPASVAISVSTATTTQLVAISGSTKIYVTSFDVIAAGTGNITFEYGTGSTCGTGTTVLTGAYNLTAQAGISKGNGLGAVLVVPAGNALCVLTSAAVQMSGSISYQQF